MWIPHWISDHLSRQALINKDLIAIVRSLAISLRSKMDRRRLTEATKTKLEWCVIAKEKIRNRFEKFRKKIVACFFCFYVAKSPCQSSPFAAPKWGDWLDFCKFTASYIPSFYCIICSIDSWSSFTHLPSRTDIMERSRMIGCHQTDS